MVDFSKLKKLSGKKSLDKLADRMKKMNAKFDGGTDNRFWKPTTDKAGTGSAIIRFLPSPDLDPDDEESLLNLVRTFDHGFKGPNGWYIEKSRTTLKPPHDRDPLAEYNKKLWNSGSEDDKETARKQKRKLSYISNIYVISDPANPETEGKVFLYRYGKKIFDKINSQMNPEFADEVKINPFDMFEGANFKLKIRKNQANMPDYEKSEFTDACPLFDDEDEIEAVFKQTYSLLEFIDPVNFKTYDELKARLNLVLGLDEDGDESVTTKKVKASKKPTAVVEEDDEEDEVVEETDEVEEEEEPAPKRKAIAAKKADTPPWDDDGDEEMEWLQNLAKKGKK